MPTRKSLTLTIITAALMVPSIASAQDQAQITGATLSYGSQHVKLVDLTSDPLPYDLRVPELYAGVGPGGTALRADSGAFISPQNNTPAVTLPASRSAVVTGTVIDQATGLPSAGQPVTVSVIPDGQQGSIALTSATTDAEGQFTALVPPGVSREVIVSCCTYATQAAVDAPTALTLSDGWGAFVNEVNQPTVHAQRHGGTLTVTGKIIVTPGDPSGAWVQVYTRSAGSGIFEPVDKLARTSASGDWSLSFQTNLVSFLSPRSGRWPKAESVQIRATVGSFQHQPASGGNSTVVYQPGYPYAEDPAAYNVGVSTATVRVPVPASLRATPIP